jgi:hypothetical protein
MKVTLTLAQCAMLELGVEASVLDSVPLKSLQ